MVCATVSTGRLLGLSSLAGLFVVPEGLAVPFGHQIGATTSQIGLLLAAVPLGSAVGAVLLVRFVRGRRRTRAAAVMAVGPAGCRCWRRSGTTVGVGGGVLVLVRRSRGVPGGGHHLDRASRASRPPGRESRVSPIRALLGAQGTGSRSCSALFATVMLSSRAVALAGALGVSVGLRHSRPVPCGGGVRRPDGSTTADVGDDAVSEWYAGEGLSSGFRRPTDRSRRAIACALPRGLLPAPAYCMTSPSVYRVLGHSPDHASLPVPRSRSLPTPALHHGAPLQLSAPLRRASAASCRLTVTRARLCAVGLAMQRKRSAGGPRGRSA